MGQGEEQLQPRATLPAAETRARARRAIAPWRLAKPMRDAAGVPIALRAMVAALAAGLFVLIAVAPSAAALTPSFVATDLGTLPGCNSTLPAAINAGGQVVGYCYTANGVEHAFFWTRAGGMVDLGTLGGPLSRAQAMNDRGQVVGASDTAISLGDVHAFSWTPAGGMVDLGRNRWAYAVNDRGQVVGTSGGGAVLWMPVSG